MANTASRLSANGSLTISGSFDEVTYNPTSNVRVNTLSNSQQFNLSPWGTYQATVTANVVVAPDGTTTAFSLNEDTNNGEHLLAQSRTGRDETMTASYYAKAAARTRCYISLSNYVNFSCQVHYDLIAGTITFVSANNSDYSNISGTITPVGNGWFRCTLTATKGSVNNTNSFTIAPVVGSSSVYLGTGVQAIYVWGAQYEIGTQATPYVRTGTNAITLYSNNASKLLNISSNNSIMFIGGEFDEVTYNPNANVRVNLISYSQEINNVGFGTSWSAIGSITVSPSTIVSPDNKNTAYKLVLGNAVALNGAAWGQNPIKIRAAADPYTFSIYAKAGERNTIRMMIRDSANISNIIDSIINLGSKSVNSSSASGFFKNASTTINDIGNDWLRISLTGTTWFESGLRVQIYSYDSVATTGDGTSGIYIWGPQLEQNSNSTIYVPTASLATGANTIIANTFNQRTTSTGNTYIRNIYDEVSKTLPIEDSSLIVNLDPSYDVSYSGTGTTCYDISGNKNHATLNGNITFDTYNSAFNLNGGYISIPTSTSLNTISTGVTASVWVNPTQFIDGNYSRIISRDSYPTQSWYIEQGGGINANRGSIFSYDARSAVSGPVLAINTWYNITMTSNNSFTSLYVNGNVYGSSATSTFKANTAGIGIGSDANGGSSLLCKIGTVQVYNRSLTPSEILTNVNAQRTRYGV
jgi:hypothetical protein